MRDLVALVLGTYTAQSVGGLVLALLLVGFWRHYDRRYLADWSLSWFFLGLYHGTAAISLMIMNDLPPSSPLRMLNSTVAGVSGYLQLVFLLFGVRGLASGRTVRGRTRAFWIVAAAVFGAAAVLLPIAETGAVYRYFSRWIIRTFIAGLVFLVAALLVWAVRRRSSRTGLVLITTAFAAYGTIQLLTAGLSILSLGDPGWLGVTPWLGVFDYILQGMMGLGVVTVLLEDERERVLIANDEMQHLAYHDSLTGLPNRPLFIDRLIHTLRGAARHDEQVGVFFCDLDGFKEINDSLGHTRGDSLLVAVARRIREAVRSEDTVARFGGDEFTLIMNRVRSPEDAARLASKILQAVREPVRIGDHELFVTISIGVSIFPTDGEDAETLLKNADTAMYRAKEQGRDGFQLYAPAMNAQALEKLELANMLRRALERQELVLHYQPIVDLATGRVTSIEALVRWMHPDKGLVPPQYFIDAAEASGVIIPLGEWVIRRACEDVRVLRHQLGDELTVSVNLSPRQFQQPDLVKRIGHALDSGRVPASALRLEITESSAMQNADTTVHVMRELQALGVGISLDDFGTGYSSLSHLKRLPIDTLKLDQSFVRDITHDPEDEAISSAVIALAHTLGLRVVAEGVETAEQLSFLNSRGCDAVQGYLISRPVPLDAFEDLPVFARSARAARGHERSI